MAAAKKRPLTVLALLKAARALLAKKGVWTKHHYALNAKGEGVNEHSKTACQFCSIGGLNHVAGKRQNKVAFDNRITARHLLGQAVPQKVKNEIRSVIGFNDAGDTTVKDVLAMYDKAIKLAKAA